MLKFLKFNALPVTKERSDKAIVVMCVSLALIVLFSSIQWTEKLFIITALYMWLIRIDSRYSFSIALMLLISIPTFELLGKPQYNDTIAIYVFYALCIGVGGAMIELYDEPQYETKKTFRSPNKDFTNEGRDKTSAASTNSQNVTSSVNPTAMHNQPKVTNTVQEKKPRKKIQL